jgi:eukaryotic-like serine/threonine-protein kinase
MAGAAGLLLGLKLDGGWTVSEQIDLTNTTGGWFSTCYIVDHKDGTKAFLKAFDYSEAMNEPNPASVIKRLIDSFLFEWNVVQACTGKGMDRVVRGLASGTTTVIGGDAGGVAQYLIFELAEYDVRTFIKFSSRFDLAWSLRSLHHVATGLKQLHSARIAHQDLKPSNVLVFDGNVSKIGDMGRSAYQGHTAPHDEYVRPGDINYAAPESLYDFTDPDWTRRRFGYDLYHLGSMVVFFFTGLSMTHLLLMHLQPAHRPRALAGSWAGSFDEVLPYLRRAFGLAVDKFRSEVFTVCPQFCDDLANLVTYLCDPDPSRRGHPMNRRVGNPFAMERFVEHFNLLARRAELELVGKGKK